MARANGIATSKLQLTVDQVTAKTIESVVPLGIHGANRAEVAAWIIRTWIWDNQDRLRANGIVLTDHAAESKVGR